MDHLLSESLKLQKRSPLNSLELPFSPVEAAVLVLLHRSEEEDHLLFTKRSDKVAHHKGQICFPGGVKDEGDETLWKTALRENYEEIGIPPNCIHYIGQLGQLTTPTGFRVTPYVGRTHEELVCRPNPDEIAEIFSVPVSHLLDPANFQTMTGTFQDREYIGPLFSFKEYQIWGATGRILLDFLDVWKTVQKAS